MCCFCDMFHASANLLVCYDWLDKTALDFANVCSLIRERSVSSGAQRKILTQQTQPTPNHVMFPTSTRPGEIRHMHVWHEVVEKVPSLPGCLLRPFPLPIFTPRTLLRDSSFDPTFQTRGVVKVHGRMNERTNGRTDGFCLRLDRLRCSRGPGG